MHVIVLENQPTALRGGQHLSLLDVCRGLSQRGHQISLLYEQEGDLLDRYQEFCSHLINVSGYTIYRKIEIFKILSEIWQLNWKLPTTKNSIVYSNQYHDSLFGSILALSKNIPFVCHLRQCPPAKLPQQWVIGLKGAKRLVVVSNQARLDWIDSGLEANKIDVVYNAINTDKFKPATDFSLVRKEWNIPEDTHVISFVSRIDREKGVETLIKAFRLLLDTYPQSKLLLVGQPVYHLRPEEGEEYQRALEQLVANLGIEKSVDFLGYVTDTTSIYQVSDVTVLPSLWSEPFGRTVIEAMACGVPVVASRTGGIPEILTGEFHLGLFEPGNESDLAAKLHRILDWRQQDSQLSMRCRNHILTQFSLDNMVEGTERVLLQAMK